MTPEERAIVTALRERPLTELELKIATGLPSIWPHRGDLQEVGVLGIEIRADQPDEDNKLYWLI